MSVPTVADVAAAGDVLGEIQEASDHLSVEQAVAFRAEIDRLARRLKMTLSLIDAHLIRTLESPIVRDGVEYAVKRKKDRRRFDHGRIASGVQTRARYHPETGERLEDADAILKRGVQLMREIYLSPSVEAKVTVLEALGFVRDDVETYELGDQYIATSPVNDLNPPTTKEKP